MNVLNLDDPANETTRIVVTHNGQRVSLSKARIQELLAVEDQLVAVLVDQKPRTPASPSASKRKSSPATKPRGTHAAAPSRVTRPPAERLDAVTHGSLSNRIKKIFNYTLESRALRPAQASLLQDLIDRFDWRIPEHPNTRLEIHLEEMLTWRGMSPVLARAIETFLDGYLEARRLPPRRGRVARGS